MILELIAVFSVGLISGWILKSAAADKPPFDPLWEGEREITPREELESSEVLSESFPVYRDDKIKWD
tara:strand:+ start:536 stop:736 length:201 start_codon:yes stop_codon:yes gene_type:complete